MNGIKQKTLGPSKGTPFNMLHNSASFSTEFLKSVCPRENCTPLNINETVLSTPRVPLHQSETHCGSSPLSSWMEWDRPQSSQGLQQGPSSPGSVPSALGNYGEAPESSGGPTPVLTSNRYGTRWETTSTWWGCSPTSSWASRRAVAVSSVSTGSLFPPGKQTAPGSLLSWGDWKNKVPKWAFSFRTL